VGPGAQEACTIEEPVFSDQIDVLRALAIAHDAAEQAT